MPLLENVALGGEAGFEVGEAFRFVEVGGELGACEVEIRPFACPFGTAEDAGATSAVAIGRALAGKAKKMAGILAEVVLSLEHA